MERISELIPEKAVEVIVPANFSEYFVDSDQSVWVWIPNPSDPNWVIRYEMEAEEIKIISYSPTNDTPNNRTEKRIRQSDKNFAGIQRFYQKLLCLIEE